LNHVVTSPYSTRLNQSEPPAADTRPYAKIASSGGNIYSCWSACGNYMAVSNKNDTMAVYDVRTEKLVSKKHFDYEVNEFAWMEDSRHLLLATGGGNIGAVDIVSFASGDSLQVVDSVSAHFSYCVQLKVDSTFRRLAVGSLDRSVSLWDLEDMVCHHTFNFDSEVSSLSYSGDGGHIAAVSTDPLILICASDTGECVARVNNRFKVNGVAWHPKAPVLAVASDDRTLVPNVLRFLSFPNNE
jgi:WD40 repeat protein